MSESLKAKAGELIQDEKAFLNVLYVGLKGFVETMRGSAPDVNAQNLSNVERDSTYPRLA